MYTVFFVYDSSPYYRVFKSKRAMNKWIKDFPSDLDEGYWIKFWVTGEVNYIDY